MQVNANAIAWSDTDWGKKKPATLGKRAGCDVW